MKLEPDIDERQNPWQRLSSLDIYENPWIRVCHEEVIHPNGQPGIYGTIHFKNNAVGVIPIDPQGYTWLVGQYRYPLRQWSWEIPMGGVPAGESTELGAIRELAEETGLRASRLRHLLSLHTSNSITDEIAEVYVGYDLIQGPAAPDDSEQLKIKKVLLTDAIEMVLQGQITDAISVAALLKVQQLKIPT